MAKTRFTLLMVYLGLVMGEGLTEPSKKPSAIVIGAGPSGIAAATRLLNNNVDVVVLEAEPRIGGRVNSQFFGDAYVDLGAEWCHGEVDNVVYETVKDLGVLNSSNLNQKMCFSDRSDLDEDFVKELYQIYSDIYFAEDKKYSGEKDEDSVEGKEEQETLGEYFLERYNTTVQNRYGSEPEKLDLAFTVMENFRHSIISLEGAFSWFDPAASTDYVNCEGDHNLNWSGRGFKTILEVLMKKFPTPERNYPIDDAIKLNSEVTKIIWDENRHGVTVECSDKSNYTADYVIFTSSLGVLKDKQMTMFVPSLPPKKKKAIEELGIGALIKVMMHFPVKFWPKENFAGFTFVWTTHDRQSLVSDYPHGPSKDGRSWLEELFGLFEPTHNPNVLSVWFSGDLVPEIEKLSDEAIINGTVFMLDRFIGHQYNITRPDRIMRSNWYTNPHFRGVYSHQTIASRQMKPSANLVLAEPLYTSDKDLKVLFAGEATHPHYYSTVHGAVATGFRAAEEVMSYIRIKSDNKDD